MALKEYIGLARLTQAFSLLKSKLDGKEDIPTVISYDDFMELTPEQQTSGYYLVVGGTPMANAYGISYQPNKTVGDALDDHADAISELNADIAYHATEERCGTFLGSPLYRRTFSIGAITAGNSLTIPTDLSTNANVVKLEGVANAPDAGGVINIPLYISSSYSVTFDVRPNGSIFVNTAGYSVTSGYITIYYTK